MSEDVCLWVVQGTALLSGVHRDAGLLSRPPPAHHSSYAVDPARLTGTPVTGLLSAASADCGSPAPALLTIGHGMNPRPPARNAHRNHPAVRRASVVGLLVLLACGLTGCGDPDGGGGGGGYVAQQASSAPGRH